MIRTPLPELLRIPVPTVQARRWCGRARTVRCAARAAISEPKVLRAGHVAGAIARVQLAAENVTERRARLHAISGMMEPCEKG